LEAEDSSAIRKLEADVVIDALLGTGTKGQLKPPIRQLVEHMNSMSGFKVAVDVPTGIDSDTGESLGVAVKADVTVTFHAPKTGLVNAKKYVGELVVRDIGLPRQLETYTGPGDVMLVTRKRELNAHKGDFGRLLSIGGSEVYSGAPTLVSLAALRAGVDIVYLAAPEKTARAISSMSPDLITLKLDGSHLAATEISALHEAEDAVALSALDCILTPKDSSNV
jgi:NAD(P)H-hydrate epimerase